MKKLITLAMLAALAACSTTTIERTPEERAERLRRIQCPPSSCSTYGAPTDAERANQQDAIDRAGRMSPL